MKTLTQISEGRNVNNKFATLQYVYKAFEAKNKNANIKVEFEKIKAQIKNDWEILESFTVIDITNENLVDMHVASYQSKVAKLLELCEVVFPKRTYTQIVKGLFPKRNCNFKN